MVREAVDIENPRFWSLLNRPRSHGSRLHTPPHGASNRRFALFGAKGTPLDRASARGVTDPGCHASAWGSTGGLQDHSRRVMTPPVPVASVEEHDSWCDRRRHHE
ncbi:hypothetical protein GCM10022399_11360 [Terrabacter ginsenosidimutans]|uniref:Uncharacterized protein n=1 Tax=Terrabacter ginsenosidimutans TaxID=490575 RepID=A0ABP7CY05_9MICO